MNDTLVGALVLVLVFGLYIAWKIYESNYYSGEEFLSIKGRVEKYIQDCNELNQHIEELKQTHIGTNHLDYGKASYRDSSRWNYKRPELQKKVIAPNVHNCSRSVCASASKQPFKYICKYFNIPATEESLENIETVLNNFEAAAQGKDVLLKEKEAIFNSINEDIPTLIKTLGTKRLEKELGFEPIDLSTAHFPKYVFQYTSSGGNAGTKCEILMDIDNLNRFVEYLSQTIKFKKSAAGQRALMTSKLRHKIMERDGFCCKQCGVSIQAEPNLLLEIDHIVPISKGGLTTEDNLQTLCWRCNRRKGAKIEAGATVQR